VNPLFMAYDKDAHLYAEQFAGTTAAFVMSPETYGNDEWLRVRDRGSETYEYSIGIERPNSRIRLDMFMGDPSKVPLWPYLDANGNQRRENDYTLLADIRVGSPWVTYYVDFLARRIRMKLARGQFLDGLGSQLFKSADWDNWPVGERQEWTAGAVDLARRIDEMRRAEDPSVLIVGNNYWDPKIAPSAELYVDGVVSENHPPGDFWKAVISRTTYSPLGQRRVFVINRTEAEALAWEDVPGVTHICCTAENLAAGRKQYARPTKPVVGYSDIRTAELQRQLSNAKFDLAQALGERDAAVEQCKTAEAMYDEARDQVMVLTASKSSLETKLQQLRARVAELAAEVAL
jgi:hypothetical protein